MGLGASVSTNAKAKTEPGNHLDIDAIKVIEDEIKKLEQASKDTKALDEFIDASQTYSSTSTISRATKTDLVTHSVQEAIENVGGYFDNIDTYLEKMQAKLGEFKEAVVERCEQYSEDEKLVKLSRVRQQINVVDELILKAKGRLIEAKKDNNISDMVKTLKRQVRDLEMFKSDLKASDIDSARSNKNKVFEKALRNEGSEYVIEDILKWRHEALQLTRKYEALYEANGKLRTESEEDIITLQSSNKKLIKELTELRKEVDMADEKVVQSEARVQLVEEKLLEERLSHEVEINSLKAMLEKQDEALAKLIGRSYPVTPGPDQGQVRLSPEGILGTSDNENKYKTSNSRSSSPEKENEIKSENKSKNDIDQHNDKSNDSFREWIDKFGQPQTTQGVYDDKVSKENRTDSKSFDANGETTAGMTDGEDPNIKLILDNLQTHVQDNDNENNALTVKKEVTEEQTENSVRTEEKYEKGKPESNVTMSATEDKTDKDANRQVTTEQSHTSDTDIKTQDVILFEEGTVKEIVYKRNDSEIDGNLSYHKGVGAVIQTCNKDFGVDSLSCEIIDELENNMLPDFLEGERAVSFQLHFQKKLDSDFTLKDGESFKLFVPHRHINEFEEPSLIQSVNGEDWEPCDQLNETPSSVDDVQMVCTELFDLTDIKLIAIAREKAEYIIAGETDIDQKSKYDQTITLKMPKATFKSRTEVKLQVSIGFCDGTSGIAKMGCMFFNAKTGDSSS